jgi:hypothetical protein
MHIAHDTFEWLFVFSSTNNTPDQSKHARHVEDDDVRSCSAIHVVASTPDERTQESYYEECHVQHLRACRGRQVYFAIAEFKLK